MHNIERSLHYKSLQIDDGATDVENIVNMFRRYGVPMFLSLTFALEGHVTFRSACY